MERHENTVSVPLHEAREAFERDYILQALAAQQGNISRTADALGVERSNLYRKMKSFGIAPVRRVDEEERLAASPSLPKREAEDARTQAAKSVRLRRLASL